MTALFIIIYGFDGFGCAISGMDSRLRENDGGCGDDGVLLVQRNVWVNLVGHRLSFWRDDATRGLFYDIDE